jgi:hypothetical protein
MKSITKKLKKIFSYLKDMQNNTYTPFYQLVEISEDNEEYIVTIRITNKSIAFTARPEEILSNDLLVDKFSPRDIRALTYLGYLGMNSPKYKILAKNLSQNEKISFLLKKKGEKKVLVKTAEQIISETNMILSMNAEDAKIIGYTFASEAVIDEKKQKEELLKELKKT